MTRTASAELLTVTPDPGLAPDPAPALARALAAEGVPVRGRRVVTAEDAEAERALRQAVQAGGLVVGLGEGGGEESLRRALARLLGSRLVLSERALEAVAAAWAGREQAMPRRAEGLALVPQGATVLAGVSGGEPGLLAESHGTLIALLPHDPGQALALLRAHVLGRWARPPGEPVTVGRLLRLCGIGTGEAEARVGAVLRELDDAGARVLPGPPGEVWVRLGLRAPDAAAAERRLRDLEPRLRQALGLAWYGTDEESLEGVVGRLLRASGLTLALAESCTGGLVGHRLTEVPGSSAYLERGFVVYSNAAKQALLGVPAGVLAQRGAVSAECAEAMARGARGRAGTDLGLAVTGIAGPDGGTPLKPVGTVFVGLADARGTVVRHYCFRRDRTGNKAEAATMALDLLRRRLLDPVRTG